jgi:tetratricopeptide (TPR) repeat protein
MQFVILLLLLIAVLIIAVYYFYIEPKSNHNKRAEEFLESNSLEDALTEYKKILEEHPYDFATHNRVANIYLRLKEYDQASLHFEKIIEINRYNYQVDKFEIQKKLSKIYIRRADIEKAFDLCHQILQTHPGDPDALYYVSFIALGQEEFDIAQYYFDKLVKVKRNDFDVAFGAGICCYQNKRISDAVNYFKIAVGLNEKSDIANIAFVFALNMQRDYKKTLPYIEKIITNCDDASVMFLARRLDAFAAIHMQKYNSALKKLEDLLEYVQKSELYEEEVLTRYDLGFACMKADQKKKAYEQWNHIAEHERSYRNIDRLVLLLRNEFNREGGDVPFEETAHDYVEDWLIASFPEGLLWGICGLKSNVSIDVRSYVTRVKQKGPVATAEGDVVSERSVSDSGDIIERYVNLEPDMFRLISNRAVEKIGYRVDEIMSTYRDPDGVDLMTTNKETKEKTYFWIRRWQKTKVGEIPVRNFAQAVNDLRVSKGVFMTAADVTESALAAAKRVSKIRIIAPDELKEHLKGLF